jgi:DNA-binding FadR family transcriptional regulator
MEIRPNTMQGQLGRNLTHGLLDHLGKQAITGAFDGIGFPTEAELSQQYGVSRSVTREAVKMLTAKGLLTSRPRQGTSIRPESEWNLLDTDVLRWLLERKFSTELLAQFNQLRLAIEPAAAALAATAADAEGLRMIEAGFARMVAAEHGEGDGLEADIVFHLAILSACGNPFFLQFRDLVATALRTSIRVTNRIVGRTADIAAHGAVKDAIVARDAEAARRAMCAIIDDVMAVIAKSSENG